MKSEISLDVYFNELKDFSKQINAQILPVTKNLKKEIKESMQPINSLQEIIESVGKSIQYPIFDFTNLSLLTAETANLQKSIQKIITPTFKHLFNHLQRTFRELPTHIREALLLLGENGWYLDLEMPLPSLWHLKEALAEGNLMKSENTLIEYFGSRLSEIEKSILGRLPNRRHLIKAAFNAHRREEYVLSIPVFLAQTDGICKEVIKQYLFRKCNNKPRTAIYVNQIAIDSFRNALLSPLAQTLPVNASESERPESFNGLNRHMVLHGESLDYGSRTNSLRAISLINYVSHVLE